MAGKGGAQEQVAIKVGKFEMTSTLTFEQAITIAIMFFQTRVTNTDKVKDHIGPKGLDAIYRIIAIFNIMKKKPGGTYGLKNVTFPRIAATFPYVFIMLMHEGLGRPLIPGGQILTGAIIPNELMCPSAAACLPHTSDIPGLHHLMILIARNVDLLINSKKKTFTELKNSVEFYRVTLKSRALDLESCEKELKKIIVLNFLQ